MRQGLEMVLYMTGGKGATGIQKVEARGAAKHPAVRRTAPQQNHLPCTPLVTVKKSWCTSLCCPQSLANATVVITVNVC